MTLHKLHQGLLVKGRLRPGLIGKRSSKEKPRERALFRFFLKKKGERRNDCFSS